MNASFRTAFWAMCLGFTVPMVLFVGVELTTGGKARTQKTASTSDRRGSLLQQLTGRTVPRGQTADQAAGDPELAATTEPGGQGKGGKVVLDGLEEDASDPHVVLGPGVESEPASAGAGRPDRHIPANSVAETRPRAHIDPRIEPIPAPHAVAISGIEARLTDIQQHLAKLGRALETHTAPPPPGDPVKQATEFLKQLQDAHLIQGPNPQPERIAARTPQDELETPPESPEPERSVPDVYSHPPEAETPELIPAPKPQTQIYRPRFLTGSALQALIQPLLTPHVGRIGAADMLGREGHSAGPAGTAVPTDAVIVTDLPEVIEKIDALVQKLDTPAEKVVVEAVILSVQLGAERPHGIDLLEFNNAGQPFTLTTTEGGLPGAAASTRESPGAADDPLLLTRRYGLKRGILNGDPQAFLSALQSAAPVRRTDAWQVTIVSRQLANLMLGDPFGAGGSADPSTAATILGIRPIIAREGIVHLDVRQDVGVDLAAAAGSRSAALSHQFTLYPGQTAVMGGFYADQAIVQCYRPPVIGSIPLFGRLFSREMSGIDRAETIVLLTPHVLSAQSDPQIARNKRHVPRTSGRPILGEQNQTIIPVSGTSDRPSRKLRPAGR